MVWNKMLGLNKKEKRIFRNSLFGHLVIACGIAVFAFLPSCEEEPEEIHVFELAASQTYLEPLPSPPKPTPPLPRIINKPESKQPPRPVVVKKTTPPPKTATTTKKINTPSETKKTAPSTPPTPPARPEAISIEQFRKSQNLPPTAPIRPKIQAMKPIKIDPKNYSLPKIKVTQNTTLNPSASAGAVNRYLGRVKAKLESIWRKLLEDAALNSGGEARLSFRISSNGTIVSPRLSVSSGNPTLDRLVFEVSKRAGNFGSPPGGKLESTLEIPFRVN